MTKIDLPGPLYDIAGAAEYLGVSRSTINYYVYELKTLTPDAYFEIGKRRKLIFTQATLDALERRAQGWPKNAWKGRIDY